MLLLQLAIVSRRATTAMIEAERGTLASSGAGTALTSIAVQVPAFETLPVFEALRGSSDGRLMVVRYSAEGDDEFQTWLIDTDRFSVDCLTLSTGHRILDARGNLVLVAALDEWDVPRLELRLIGSEG